MKNIKPGFLFCVILAFLGCTHMQVCQDWNNTDTALLVATEVLTFFDYRQTREIAKHPDRYFEKYNSLCLGSHPSEGQVNTYFVISALTKAGIACLLPPNKQACLGIGRETALIVFSGISIGMIGNNLQVGLTFNF